MKKAKFTLNDLPPKSMTPPPEEDEMEMEKIMKPPKPKKIKEKKPKKEKVKKVEVPKPAIPVPPKEKVGRPMKIPGNLDPKSKEAIALYVAKCREVHQFKYEYKLDHYPSSNEKISCICKEHGPFEQRSVNHLRGSGCQKCARKKPITKPKRFKIQFIFYNISDELLDSFEAKGVEVVKRLNLVPEVKKGKSYR